MQYNTKQIRLAYKSKYDYKRDNQVILLMITDIEKWHYLALKSLSTSDGKKWCNLAVKSLPALLRGITSNHNGDFYCLNCVHSYSTKNKLKEHQRVCGDHDYCYVEIPNEDNKILKYNHGEKSLKVPFTIYVDLESLLVKMYYCQNNPENSYTEKKAKHTPSGYSWFTCWLFDASQNKLGYCRGKKCMKKLCKDFRDQVMKIINYEKRK